MPTAAQRARIAVDLARLFAPRARLSLKGVAPFLRDYRAFRRAARLHGDHGFPIDSIYAVLKERYESAGRLSGDYFHQDLHVARLVHADRPVKHVDVGSRIDGFVAHVAVFCPVEIIDIRPVVSKVPNIAFRQADLMRPVPELEGKCRSVSCLHALEHFGLGRYGDPVDPAGHLKGYAAVSRLVAPGGKFYLSTPIGPQRIEFNAHRVFALPTLINLTKPDFELVSLSYVDDAGDLHASVPLDHPGIASSFGCTYGCGILELRRKTA